MKDLINLQLDNTILLKDLFDDAHDLIQIVQLDGTLMIVNNAWSSLLGYNKDEIEGKLIYSFIDEKDRKRYEEYRNRIINGHDAGLSIIFDMYKKSGHIVTVEGVVSVKRVNGEPLYTRGIFRDISPRLQFDEQLQRLNKELKEREQNLEQLLLQAPDAVIVIDQQSHILFWNPKAEALFGWTAEEVLQQNLSAFIIPPQYREAHHSGMKRYLATGEARVLNRTIEITAINKDGQEFYVALTISSTQQNNKTVFIAFIRNITEQKHNQLELENKTKQLERSNAYLEDFAHLASHDLKEPLRKILTFTDRLKESLKNQMTATDSNYFNRLEAAAERMQLLVDDLLEFSHVRDQPHELEHIDLNAKILKVQEDLELLIEEKKAHLIIGELPTILGNRRQLQQLFHNLIGNALKYSKKDVRPVIEISSRVVSGADASISLPAELKEKHFYLIEVRDNGIGFEQEYAAQIFEVFRRLHGKAEYAGSGVGLSIASKVVSNHHGYIWANSKPGEGSTFHVLLPVE